MAASLNSPSNPNLKFAGIWMSDSAAPIYYTGKKSPQLIERDGVVAISGRVPILISVDDLKKLNVGDPLFIGFDDGQKCSNSANMCSKVNRDVACSSVCYSSHQQLAVAPVSLNPPKKKGPWGIPKFAPVVFTNPDKNEPAPSYRPVVGCMPKSIDPDVDFDDGIRTFRIENNEGMFEKLLPEVSSFIFDQDFFLEEAEKIKRICQSRFIGTLAEKNEIDGGALVDLSSVLVYTA